MLSIHPMGSGAEDYYLELATGGADEYYPTEGPGAWVGSGAGALGLAGEVGPDELRALLAGRHPGTGEALADGVRAARRRRPGFDLTFSAPKGVSVLAALDPRARPVVEAAHHEATAAALGYLEEHLWACRGADGHRRQAVGGVVGAAFTHRTSRAADPQLHTHVLVANLVRGTDGVWSAPDGRPLFRHLVTAGHLYQSHLRAELTESIGLAWAPVRNGMAEPLGFDAAQLRAFSRRRCEIEAGPPRATPAPGPPRSSPWPPAGPRAPRWTVRRSWPSGAGAPRRWDWVPRRWPPCSGAPWSAGSPTSNPWPTGCSAPGAWPPTARCSTTERCCVPWPPRLPPAPAATRSRPWPTP